MLNLLYQNPAEFLVVSFLLLIAISIHEFSHALAADYLGDPTPRLAGRLTLNPFAHLDPIGTLLLLFAGFGWGKPVPFDPFNLRNIKRDSSLISFAGPFSNLILAIVASLILRTISNFSLFLLSSFFVDILSTFIYFNVLLAVFNLIPIHPLDGFKVVAGILPQKYYHDWLSLERYGILFLFLLIFPILGSPPIFSIISPIVNFILSFLIPTRMGGII
jgi:Zn-dependent protease